MSEREFTTAERACYHIYRRVQDCSNFAWLMIGTESLALCCEAIAEHCGDPVAKVRAFVQEQSASARETPELVRLRNQVESLEKKLALAKGKLGEERSHRIEMLDDELEGATRNRRALEAVEELVRLADLGCEDLLTVENLREALDGEAMTIYRPTARRGGK